MKRMQTLLAASVLAFAACKEKAAPEGKAADPANQSANQSQVAAPKPAFAAPDTFKTALGRLYEGYLGMQSALAQDDFEKAKSAFSSMHGLLHTMPKDSLDGADWLQKDSTVANPYFGAAMPKCGERVRAL